MRPLRAIAAFRRLPDAPVAPQPRPARAAPTAARSEASAEPIGRDADLVDAIEADVLTAIGAVTGAIEKANREVGATSEDLGAIHAHMSELAAAGQGVALQTVGLAASTEGLAAASGDIGGAMGRPLQAGASRRRRPGLEHGELAQQAHLRRSRRHHGRPLDAALPRPVLSERHGRGAMIIMREVDAPIRVLGRQWGGFRTVYRL